MILKDLGANNIFQVLHVDSEEPEDTQDSSADSSESQDSDSSEDSLSIIESKDLKKSFPMRYVEFINASNILFSKIYTRLSSQLFWNQKQKRLRKIMMFKLK